MLHELSVTLQGAIPTSKKAQPEKECLNTIAFNTCKQMCGEVVVILLTWKIQIRFD